jgi:hypothetical protein
MYNFGFWDKLHQMSKAFHFGKHCSCNLQGNVYWGGVMKQAVHGEWDVKDMTGGTEKWGATVCNMRTHA